jgi:hypothetical protein
VGVALLEEVDEMKAVLPARKGSRAVVGLAVYTVSSRAQPDVRAAGTHLAEPLRPQTA